MILDSAYSVKVGLLAKIKEMNLDSLVVLQEEFNCFKIKL